MQNTSISHLLDFMDIKLFLQIILKGSEHLL